MYISDTSYIHWWMKRYRRVHRTNLPKGEKYQQPEKGQNSNHQNQIKTHENSKLELTSKKQTKSQRKPPTNYWNQETKEPTKELLPNRQNHPNRKRNQLQIIQKEWNFRLLRASNPFGTWISKTLYIFKHQIPGYMLVQKKKNLQDTYSSITLGNSLNQWRFLFIFYFFLFLIWKTNENWR